MNTEIGYTRRFRRNDRAMPTSRSSTTNSQTDAKAFVEQLGGEWHGDSGNAPCPICQVEARANQRALSVRQGGSKLLVYCHKSNCAFDQIFGAANIISRWPPNSFSSSFQKVARPNAKNKTNGERAKEIWKSAEEISGTHAEAYLRNRSITSSLPKTLRFLPGCWHGQTKRTFPALVARVDGSDSPAIHRTFLNPSRCEKADVSPDKTMLGNVRGGAVHLSNGSGPLVVCEGIETGLSLLSGILCGPVCENATVWAALSTAGMKALHLPDPGVLVIATDGDQAGIDAGEQLAVRAHHSGWTVSFLHASQGRDWNDVLQEREANYV